MLQEYVRYAAAAPFSKAYRGRLRWLREAKEWEEQGIAIADMKHKALVVPGTGAVYLAVSKAANSSLSFILSTEAGANSKNIHLRGFKPQRLIDAGGTFGDLANGTRPVFTFVRHPVTRFWSAYSNKIAHVRKGRKVLSKLTRARAHSGPITPEDVVDYVANTPVTEIDEHFRPQWSCTGAERLPFAFIGKVETLGPDLETLVGRGLLTRQQVDRLPHFNASPPFAPANKQEIDKKLREIYRKDFELFGYD